jgi:hypothetical protein
MRIEADLCGPVSVGTVGVIKLLRDRLALDLRTANEYVDRCVFDGESVVIPAPSLEAAEGVVTALAAHPRVHATVRP